MAISKTHELVGKQTPIYQTGEYILPIKRLIEGFQRQDPPTVPQIAAPVAVPEAALKLTSIKADKKSHTMGYLVTIDLYYLLRSGEYTKPRRIKRNGRLVRATITRQL